MKLCQNRGRNVAKRLIPHFSSPKPSINHIISSFLTKEGFSVYSYFDGTTLLEAFHANPPDLIVLDVVMPGIDGFSLCSKLREFSPVPIIFVSAKDKELDRIQGLMLGGDDYLTKPFSPLELIARIRSLFRRIDLDREGLMKHGSPLILGDLALNSSTKEATIRGVSLNLTLMEFSLLYYLVANRDRAIPRSELLDKVWGFEAEVETRATDDMIKRVRRKLTESHAAVRIETVWGYGFRITEVSK